MYTVKKNCNSLQAICIVTMVIFNSFFANAQSMQMTIKNFQIVSANSFDYEVHLKNTSANTVLLSGYSWGINLSSGIANGGTLTHTYLNRDLPLNNLSLVTSTYDIVTNQLKATTVSTPPGSEFSMFAGTEVMVAKMRVQTTASAWLPNFNPLLPVTPAVAVQAITEIGRVQCVALIVDSATSETFAIVGTGNSANQYVVPSLTTTLSPNPTGATPFILNPAIALTLTLDQNVTCHGSADGVVFANATGFSGNFVYDIDGGTAYTNTNGIFTGLAPGTHTICAKAIPSNVINCEVISIAEPDAIMVSLTVDATVSSLGNDGALTATVTGGTTIDMPHIMSWFNNVTTSSMFDLSVSGLAVGTYTVVAEDDNGCTSSSSIVLPATPPIVVTASNTPIACTGATSVITAISSGGTGTLTNTISGGSFTVVAGTYTITATDANGNTATTQIIISDASQPCFQLTVVVDQNISCAGAGDGVLLASATGASGNFLYDIDGGTSYANSTGLFFGLAPGTHTICAKEIPSNIIICETSTLIDPDSLTVILSIDATVSCLGNDGALSANVTGGTLVVSPSYLTTWYNNVNTNSPYDLSVSGLSAGTYTVVVEDDNACSASATILLNGGSAITVTATNTPITCNGGTSVVTASSSGGTGALTNTISGGSFTVGAGTYTITTTDANGCTGTTTILVTQPPLLNVGSTSSPLSPACAGASITLNGTGANTYVWSGGVTNNIPFVINATTTYTVTGTDVNGCTNTATKTITVNPLPTVGSTSSPLSPVCAGTSITLNGTGANTYVWSGGVTNNTPFVINATTTYTVTGTDVNGCTNTATKTITVNPLPTVGSTSSPLSPVCAGTSITLNGTGANTYVWSGAVTNNTPFVINATTTYTVTGTDVNGCTKTATKTIALNPSPNPTITGGTVFNGSGTLHAGNYSSYLWSTGASTSTININTTGTYSVIVTDANGCTGTASQYDIVNAQAISCGSLSSHSAFLCTIPGIPKTCGYNSNGQLGDGTITNKTIAVQVSGLTGITANAVGRYHSLFLKNDGTVWACGRNEYGQLGDGTTTQKTIAVQVSGLTGITAIVVGERHSLFLKNDGTVWACGANFYGQLGDGTTTNKTIAVQVSGLIGITAIASGVDHSLFLKKDGMVWACGRNFEGQLGIGTYSYFTIPMQVSSLTGITAIAGGWLHSLFLKKDATVWACGANGYGQLGDGSTTNKPIPVQVSGLTEITAISGGGFHSLFLKNDATVWACGYNVYGQLGDGSTTNKTIAIQVSGLTGITAIAGGHGHSLFLKNDATVWACGANTVGQLGDGTSTNKINPVQIYPCCNNPSIPTLTATANPLCASGATTLSIASGNLNSATNWRWYAASCGGTFVGTGSTINVSPTSTTTYFARGEGACVIPGACGSITITVNPSPTITSLGANPNPVCQGSMATLTATSTGNITWSGGVSNNIPFTPTASSIYTVTATGANSCTKTATVSVTVNSLPTVGATASITTPICAGTLITLNGTGASTYSWSGGVINGNVFAPLATTTYTVTGTAANGCTNTASLTVAVNQATTHTTVVATCNTGYLWQGPLGDGILHNTSGTFTHVSLNANNCQHTETLQLSIMGIPTITANTSSSTICAGSAISINAFGGITYTWTPGSLSGATINPTPLATTIYTVTGTNAGGCTSMATILVNVNPTANVNPIANQLVCTNGSTMLVNFTGALPNTIYKWTNSNPAIGLAANGIGNISPFIAQNNGTTPITSTITVTPLNGNSFAYITNQNGYVTPINTVLNTASANISTPGNIFGICVSPNGNTVYTTSNNGNVYSINSNIATAIALGGSPKGICISPDGNKLYTANGTSVSVVDLLNANAVSTLGSGLTSPNGICISPDGNKLFVANGKVSIIPTNGSAVSTITTLGSAVNCVVSPDGSKLFVANGNNISVYNLNAINNPLQATVSVGLNPYGLCFSPDGSKLYISNSSSNNVVRMNTSTHTLIGSAIAVGTSPRGISVTPDGKKLFVANSGTANVSIINLTAKIVEATIPVLGAPNSLGNFITGSSCQGVPITFTITVKPSSHVSTVTACSPYIWPTPLGSGAQITNSGTYTNISTDADGCPVTETLQLTIVNPNTTIQTTKIADGCYTWPVNGVTYYQTGNYTFNETVPCSITHTLNLTINQCVKLAAKIFLAGCYSTTNGLMNDDLRFKNLIPSSQSYIPFIPGYLQMPLNSTLESIPIVSPAILSVTGPKAIVDWVFLELRDPMNASVIVRTKRALLQRDGSIVSCLDGVSPVFFENTSAGNYYIVVRHRNHLGVMSANTLSLDPCLVANIDFTSVETMVYEKPDISTNPPQKYIGNGIMAMWAGDANFNRKVQFNGTNNDKNVLLLAAPSPILNQYRLEDLNLDGDIYNATPASDRNVILINTLNSVSNAIYSQHTP